MVQTCALALLNYNVLPVAGGVLDQPESLWRDIMRFLTALYDTMEILRPETGADEGYDADDPRTWFKQTNDSEHNARLGLW